MSDKKNRKQKVTVEQIERHPAPPDEIPAWKTRVVRTVGEAIKALQTLPPGLPIGLPENDPDDLAPGESVYGEGVAIVLFNRKRSDKCIEFLENDGTFE